MGETRCHLARAASRKRCGAMPDRVAVTYEPGPDGKTRAHFELLQRTHPTAPGRVFRAVNDFPAPAPRGDKAAKPSKAARVDSRA